MRLTLALAISSLLPTAWSWGAAGHEIIATIAQIHLHPSVRERLCTVLPPEVGCHLAPVAAWADQVRMRYRGSAPMHYINAKQDHPAEHCEFGEHGWYDEDVNVLTAIMNFTHSVMDGQGDIPLRFLVHFVGDMHQPLHLAGRDKGGNGAMFLFEGRHRNLHSVWDSGIITKNIRELGNYTSPVPSKQIESALLGAIFDPYVRWIVWEGIRQWWRDDLESWLSCPSKGDPYPHSSHMSIPASSSKLAKALKSVASSALDLLPPSLSSFLTSAIPIHIKQTGFEDLLLASHPDKLAVKGENFSFPACPFTWANEIHDLNCDVAWPAEYTGTQGEPLIELDTDQYIGRLKKDKTVEKLLAMAGIRLAKIVNEAFGAGAYEGVYLGY